MPFATLDDSRIRYRLTGPAAAAPPLVLVHGAAGAHYVWLEQLDGLAGELRMLALDLPGHGGSPAPPAPLDIAGHARIAAALTRTLGIGPAVWVGHSMGGAIALTAALHHPAQVCGLGLLATGARLPVAEPVFEALGQGLDAFAGLLALTAYGPTSSPEVIQRYTNGPIQASLDTVRADFEACQRFDVRGRLAEIAVPALVLGGEADALVGQGRLRQLAAGLPRAHLEILAGAGHMVMQEQGAAVNATLRALLRDVRAERPDGESSPARR
jgi:pimeloyl-ACP methyl ester carboxylesterase